METPQEILESYLESKHTSLLNFKLMTDAFDNKIDYANLDSLSKTKLSYNVRMCAKFGVSILTELIKEHINKDKFLKKANPDCVLCHGDGIADEKLEELCECTGYSVDNNVDIGGEG